MDIEPLFNRAHTLLTASPFKCSEKSLYSYYCQFNPELLQKSGVLVSFLFKSFFKWHKHCLFMCAEPLRRLFTSKEPEALNYSYGPVPLSKLELLKRQLDLSSTGMYPHFFGFLYQFGVLIALLELSHIILLDFEYRVQ